MAHRNLARDGLLPAAACLGLLLAWPTHAPARGQVSSPTKRLQGRNPNPKPNETVTWSGTCRTDMPMARASLQWYIDGAPSTRYEGALVRGAAVGSGQADHARRRQLRGRWLAGKQDGKRTYRRCRTDALRRRMEERSAERARSNAQRIRRDHRRRSGKTGAYVGLPRRTNDRTRGTAVNATRVSDLGLIMKGRSEMTAEYQRFRSDTSVASVAGSVAAAARAPGRSERRCELDRGQARLQGRQYFPRRVRPSPGAASARTGIADGEGVVQWFLDGKEDDRYEGHLGNGLGRRTRRAHQSPKAASTTATGSTACRKATAATTRRTAAGTRANGKTASRTGRVSTADRTARYSSANGSTACLATRARPTAARPGRRAPDPNKT